MYMMGWLNFTYLVLLLLQGLWLVYLMRRFHYFEYMRARRQIVLQLALFSVIVFTNIFICSIGIDTNELMLGNV